MKPSSLPGPDTISVAALSNGMRVWVYENFSSPTIVLSASLRSGAECEQANQAGLAQITAAMLRRGTRHVSFDRINEQLEEVGASLGFGSGRHTVSIDCKCLCEDFDLTLELLSGCLAEPAFDEGQLELLRAQFLTSIQERQHNTRSTASLAFRELLFPDHPYGRALSGYEHTITPLTRGDLAAFYQDWIRPADGVVVVVGAITATEAVARLERSVGQWSAPAARPVPPTPSFSALGQTATRFSALAGKSQSDIVLGWQGLASRHPDYDPARVCNSILGQFGMGGRLGNNVRERQGMAYYASSHLETNMAGGSWYAIAGVNPTHVDQTVQTILSEIERITQEPVSEEELAEVQSRLVGSLPLQLETNAGIATHLLEMAWHELGLDYLLSYAGRIYGITRDDVLRVAQSYLKPECYVLSVAGPEYGRREA